MKKMTVIEIKGLTDNLKFNNVAGPTSINDDDL